MKNVTTNFDENNYVEDINTFISSLKKSEIPQDFPNIGDIFCSNTIKYFSFFMTARERVCDDFSMWAIVTKKWVKILAKELKEKIVLETHAGKGWLAKALREEGIDVIATDDNVVGPVTDVEKLTVAKAIEKYSDKADVLLISWPPYDCPEASTAIKKLPENYPVIYIGEGQGGCTGDDGFHDQLIFEDTIDIPQWPGIHDRVFIGNICRNE